MVKKPLLPTLTRSKPALPAPRPAAALGTSSTAAAPAKAAVKSTATAAQKLASAARPESVASRIGTAARSGFTPTPPRGSRPTLEVQLPQVKVTQDAPTYRLPGGIVLDRRQTSDSSAVRPDGLPGRRLPTGIVPEGSPLAQQLDRKRGNGPLSTGIVPEGSPLTALKTSTADALRLSGATRALDQKLQSHGTLTAGELSTMAALQAKLGKTDAGALAALKAKGTLAALGDKAGLKNGLGALEGMRAKALAAKLGGLDGADAQQLTGHNGGFNHLTAAEEQEQAAVRAAVDATISPDATPEQRSAAEAAVQAYVDEVGGLGDTGINPEALPAAAARVLQENGIPAAVEPQVATAVDRELSPTATPEQRAEAYRAAQAQVAAAGGVPEDGLPAVVNDVLVAASIPSKAGDAAAEVEALAASGANPREIAEAVEANAANLSDAAVDAYLTKLTPTLGAAAGDISTPEQLEAFLGPLARVGEKASAEALAGVADAVFAQVPEHTLEELDSSLKGFVNDIGLNLASAFVEAAGRANNVDALSKTSEAITEKVTELQGQYDTAATARAEAQARLDGELAQVGVALTDAERAAYVDAFWSRDPNDDIKANEERLANELSQTLASSGGALEQAAIHGSEEAVTALTKGYAQLARSPDHADEAVRWAGELNQNPALTAALDEHVEGSDDERVEGAAIEAFVSEQILAHGIPNAQAELLAKGLEPAQFDAQLEELVGDLQAAGTFKDIPGAVTGFLQDIQALRNGEFDVLQGHIDGWEGKSPLGKALAVGAVGAGLYGVAQSALDGEFGTAVKDLLSTSEAGLELAAGVLGSYARAGRFAAQAAGTAADFASRALPGVSLIVGGIQLAEDVGALGDGATAGEIVKVVGSAISSLGDIAELVPGVGTVVGALVGTLGAVVRGVGTLIEGEGVDPFEETQAILEELGFSKEEAENLVGLSSTGVLAELGFFGLTPEQVREVVSQQIDVEGDRVSGQAGLVAIINVANEFGIHGDDFVELLEAAGLDEHNNPVTNQIVLEMIALKNTGLEGEELREALLDVLRGWENVPEEFIEQLEEANENYEADE
jgi:hypothetical protein